MKFSLRVYWFPTPGALAVLLSELLLAPVAPGHRHVVLRERVQFLGRSAVAEMVFTYNDATMGACQGVRS